VINADDANAPLWRTLAGAHQFLEFGLDVHADVSGTWHPYTGHPLGYGLQLDVTVPQECLPSILQVPVYTTHAMHWQQQQQRAC